MGDYIGKFKYRIRDLRRLKNMTMTEFGKAVGVAKTTVSNWETGRNFPSQDTLIKIANVFEITTDFLLGKDENSDEKPRIALDGNPDDLTDEQKIELQNFANYLISKNKK